MPAGVESVRRFVQDQHLGIAEQGMPDAQPLPHAEGVVADASPPLLGTEADQREDLVGPGPCQSHHGCPQGQDFPTGTTGMLRGGIEQHADASPGVAEGRIGHPEHRRGATAGRRQSDEHAERGGLARTVRAEEPGDRPRGCVEGDRVDGGVRAVPLRESFYSDHAVSVLRWPAPAHRAPVGV